MKRSPVARKTANLSESVQKRLNLYALRVVGETWANPHECCWRTVLQRNADRECNRNVTTVIPVQRRFGKDNTLGMKQGRSPDQCDGAVV